MLFGDVQQKTFKVYLSEGGYISVVKDKLVYFSNLWKGKFSGRAVWKWSCLHAMNIAKSALSFYGIQHSGVPIGSNTLVIRFLKVYLHLNQ